MRIKGTGSKTLDNDWFISETQDPGTGNGTRRIWVWLAVGVAVSALVAILILTTINLQKSESKQTRSAAAAETALADAIARDKGTKKSDTPLAEPKPVPTLTPEPIWPPVQRPSLTETPSADWLFEKGMQYLEAGQYFNGLAYVGMAANEGSYSAQYRMYVTYNNGDGGMPQEDIVAAYWNRVRNRQSAAMEDPLAGKGTLREGTFSTEYDRSVIYFRDGEYPSAIAYLGMLANEGDMSAQYLLAQCYMEGVTKDRYPQFSVYYDAIYAAGIYWLEQAAKQGHCCAQGYLGYCYRTGRGVEQDLANAFAWDRLSARQDCPFGLIHIGYFYADPRDDLHFVEKNYFIARMFYEAAEAANHCYATTRLQELEKQVAESQAVKGHYVDELDVRSAELEKTDPTEVLRMQERSQGITIKMIVTGGDT